jgi:hypothetical protein
LVADDIAVAVAAADEDVGDETNTRTRVLFIWWCCCCCCCCCGVLLLLLLLLLLLVASVAAAVASADRIWFQVVGSGDIADKERRKEKVLKSPSSTTLEERVWSGCRCRCRVCLCSGTKWLLPQENENTQETSACE